MKKKLLFEKLPEKIPSANRWAYAACAVAFLLFFNFLTVGAAVFGDPALFLKTTFLNAAILGAAFGIQSAVGRYITRRYADVQQTLVRVALSICMHAVVSGVFVLLAGWLYIGWGLFRSVLTADALVVVYMVNLAAIVLGTGLWESFDALARWRQHEINSERLMKENVNGQLESLKTQISPHFLFNTLNSLSALIGEDPQKAEQFVDEMARVYRYLLQTNHSSVDQGDFGQLTTLKKELSFIESYGHLLKTRYGDGMKLYIHVEDSFLDARIPPLTLQLLVENAVKHNVIRASRPLTIFILSTVEGGLMVRNNLQKKNLTAGAENIESTHVGLANIITKYKLLAEYRAWPGPADGRKQSRVFHRNHPIDFLKA
ncbi:sensor histidine kinase [Dyadobacter fermentans]|uniref:Signal transduction histidine kinase, LytS n=1 Tax=Dyadobacter fermentans (strain ATCC 700827 / DSM 18053 / CIP 107007 / KCTC 52180 / NS114) TaxID=471854 RepID=C6W684_DYAFD|nr:sensor histidine kinase [Dyadobacter fermentans]ACT92564.1 signal transduction histidine kinase, LytS [Dyadobacter fermentans DSM 18053]